MKFTHNVLLSFIVPVAFFLSAPLFGADSISAHFGKTAAVLNTVVINEINYNSAQSFDSGDWVELYNVSAVPVDISGWIFKDSNDSNSFIIPEGSVIPADGYFLIVNDAAKFLDTFKHPMLYTGNFGFGLSSAGEQVRLFDASENLADSVTYGIEGDWPSGPNGGGSTLSLRNPFIDNAPAPNWAPSLFTGTPGEKNNVFVQDIIVINEINYNSPEMFNPEDWVEFYNRYDIPVDISGWIFKDAENIYTFVFPENTFIAPGEFFIACRDTSLFKQSFGEIENVFGNFEFGLSGGGEKIYLYDAYGNTVDEVYYNDVPPWPVDADGKGTTLSLTNYTFDNLHADNWASSLGTGTPGKINDVFIGGTIIINEINYNSFTMDSDDWVELYNSHKTTIDLSGWVLKDNSDIHAYVFPDDTFIGPEGYLVICSNALKFFDIFPKVTNYIGDTGFGLGNYGDRIRIFNAEGALVDSLTYQNTAPWPVGADGTGHTLELLHPSYDNALPENWAESVEYGTPGKRNSVYAWEPSSRDTYALGQNYPNPFKETTTIPIYVPVESRVAIEIYSILGRRVAKTFDDRMLPGENNIIFTPENLPSGLYIYTIKAGTFTKSKMMLYLK
ncbi:lamin tail domain-containing protein [Candidatus Latescibacterota bacterium]